VTRPISALLAAALSLQAGESIIDITLRVSDLERAARFYSGLLGLPRIERDRFLVNERQSIVLTTAQSGPRIAFTVTGSSEPVRWNDVEMRFAEPRDRALPSPDRRVVKRLVRAGFGAKDLEAALRFWRDRHRFTEFWRGGRNPGEVLWIMLAIPGAKRDHIEIIHEPEHPSYQQLGSIYHIAFDVPELQLTAEELAARGLVPDDRTKPRIGPNGHWLMNIHDPDGNRIEITEPQPSRDREGADNTK
jgi:catechol 2,3-dioxygenase-like lactoylglutathione lyase family enzyme